jgi:hypothetical protein
MKQNAFVYSKVWAKFLHQSWKKIYDCLHVNEEAFRNYHSSKYFTKHFVENICTWKFTAPRLVKKLFLYGTLILIIIAVDTSFQNTPVQPHDLHFWDPL